MAHKITDEKIEELKKQFKGKGVIFTYGLKYLTYNIFFVNKQFDNKNFCVVAVSDNLKSESVTGLFRTKKAAVEFGIALGLKEVPSPIIPES
jgi:hypothetical protein